MSTAIPRFFFFFKNMVGVTEVATPNTPCQLAYFMKPFSANFLSRAIKKHLVFLLIQ